MLERERGEVTYVVTKQRRETHYMYMWVGLGCIRRGGRYSDAKGDINGVASHHRGKGRIRVIEDRGCR